MFASHWYHFTVIFSSKTSSENKEAAAVLPSAARTSTEKGQKDEAMPLLRRIWHSVAQPHVLVAVCILLMFIVAYRLLLQGWNLSFISMQYGFAPFDSSGVKITGPLLSDPADSMLPVLFTTIRAFNFTAWLPNMGIGTSQSMDSYLFPLNYLYMLPWSMVQALVSIIKVAVAFTGMFLFIKRLGYTWRGSFISGASYALCSVMVMWNGWLHSSVAMLAPWLFWLLDMGLAKLKVAYYAGIAIIVYLMMAAGMPTYAAYFLYLAGAYTLFYGIRTYWDAKSRLIAYCIGAGLAVAVGVLISVPYTGSLLTSVGANGYSESRRSFAVKVLELPRIWSLLFPYLPNSAVIHMNEGTLYTGILSVITLPLTFIRRRNKPRSWFFFWSAMMMLLLIFTGTFDLIYTHLPMINTSAKFRVIVLLNFSLAALVGMNIDDLLSNHKEYKSLKIQTWMASIIPAAAFAVALWRKSHVFDKATADAMNQVVAASVSVVLYVIVIIVLTVSVNKIIAFICTFAMMATTAVDMGVFAYQYFPMIEADAPTVPTATSSVRYLQQNTKHQEKYISMGTWPLFSSTNMLYGLRDILGHSFLYTNQDVAEYYKAFDSEIFDISPTHPMAHRIDNYNLLKYLGVKYIVSESGSIIDSEDYDGNVTPMDGVSSSRTVSQTFTAEANDFSSISVPLGLNGHRDSGTITATVSDRESGKQIRHSTVELSTLSDNAPASFVFTPISDSQGKQYAVTLSATVPQDAGVAVYFWNSDVYAGEAAIGNDAQSNDVAVSFGYGRHWSDGMTTRELPEYSQQIQLTDTVKVFDTNDDVLNAMKSKYESGTVFFSKEFDRTESIDQSEQPSLSPGETVTNIVNHANGNIDFDVNVNHSRYVLINEYDDGNWKAYVDGKEAPIYRGNSLFRAISVPAGQHSVQLRYEPATLKVFFIIMGVGVILLLVPICFRKRLNQCADRLKPVAAA